MQQMHQQQQNQQQKKSGTFDRLLRSFAIFGISQFVGIPFVGAIVAGLLDATAASAAIASDAVVAYSNADEAYAMMERQLEQGAQVRAITEAPDGTVEIEYDVSVYGGDDIDADALDLLGEIF